MYRPVQSCIYISSKIDIKSSIYGFRSFDNLIDIVLTFEFRHNITIQKMIISDKVDYIEIESALGCLKLHRP